jgi:uncharacterized membrane protein
MNAPLIGHSSGFNWDEALLVIAPVAVIGGLLLLARRRVRDRPGTRPGDD